MNPSPYLVVPGKRSKLPDRDPRDKVGLPERDEAEEQQHEDAVAIGRLQERL